ncbi:glycosyltransferase [Candidatus Sumerlaeota bacterium]|nr:glycosyltransferase [Candidatus Sumerlaeota bacterium]
MRPRVLHIYKDYFPPVVGGVEKTIHRLCHGLRDAFDPSVLVVNDGPETVHEVIEGISVTKAACRRRVASAPLSRALIEEIGRAEADILHYHLPMPTAVLGHLLKRPPGRVVVTWHSDIVRQRWALWAYGPFLRKFLRRHVDIVMPTSPNYIESSKWLHAVRDKCVAVPLGIEPEHFDLRPGETERVEVIRTQWRPMPIVLFVGKLRAYKGLPFLLGAMRNVPAQCLIIGEGPMRAKVERLTRGLGLTDRVHLLGELDDREVVCHLHACDILCLPSHQRSEAFGLVQVEAMMCGKPVVSTALASGVPFVNLDGETGRVVQPASHRALAEGLSELIAHRSRREFMGVRARERALAEFTAERMCERVAEVYRRALSP